MDCNEARPLLDANADHELPAPDARRVQQHIEGCAACRRDSESLRALGAALRTAPYHRASQSLRERVVAGLPQTATAAAMDAASPGHAGEPGKPDDAASPADRRSATDQSRGWPVRFENWLAALFGAPLTAGGNGRLAGAGSRLALAALVVAVCAGTAALTLNLRRPAESSVFADELVESHVRAQLSGRDIDVVSTDRHTVKPWFNGRLDYAPPVENLAEQGFTLEGGRLDYLAHQRVAVLVYRYQKHVIDVYVLPQTGAAQASLAAAPASLAREGYAIAHWDAEGMAWWAISDAAPDALRGLETALKARFQTGSERTEGR